MGIYHGVEGNRAWYGVPKRGTPYRHLTGGEQFSREGGEVGREGRGNPLPKGQDGVDGSVVGVGRERPLPLPLHDETPWSKYQCAQGMSLTMWQTCLLPCYSTIITSEAS